MRIWLNPHELAAHGLDAGDVVSALQAAERRGRGGQHRRAAAASPTSRTRIPVNALTQLSDPTQFANIILRTDPNGGFTHARRRRAGRAGRRRLLQRAALRRQQQRRRPGRPAVLHGERARAFPTRVTQKMDELRTHFPPGVHYKVAFDATTFVRGIHQAKSSSRCCSRSCSSSSSSSCSCKIRVDAHPGRDDSGLADRHVLRHEALRLHDQHDHALRPHARDRARRRRRHRRHRKHRAAHGHEHRERRLGSRARKTAMNEIQSAVVASSLVLLAVFVPVAFFPGTTGQLYKQFALTIAASITISLLQALTLAPTLSARLLERRRRVDVSVLPRVQHGLAAVPRLVRTHAPQAFRPRGLVLVVVLGGAAADGISLQSTPSAFIPDEDQGYFIALFRRRRARRSQANRRSQEGRGDHSRTRRACATSSTSADSASPARRPTAASCSRCSSRGATHAACTGSDQSRMSANGRTLRPSFTADSRGADLRVQSAGDQRRRQLRRLSVRTRGSRERRAGELMHTAYGMMGAAAQDHRAPERLHAVPHQLAASRRERRPQQSPSRSASRSPTSSRRCK